MMVSKTKFQFLEKVGIQPELLNLLKEKGIQLILGFYDVKFIDADGKEIGNYKLPKSTNEIMKGTVDPIVMEAILGGITHVIVMGLKGQITTLTGVGKLTFGGVELGKVTNVKVDVSSLKTSGEYSSKHEKTVDTTSSSHKEIKELMKQDTVPLSKAIKMYQPVKGTDPNSRYYVIAFGEGVAVAARVTSTMVSIRVEGSITDTIKNRFSKMGLNPGGNNHLSGHFDTTQPHIMPERVIGAVLLGAGINFDSPMPNLTYLKEG